MTGIVKSAGKILSGRVPQAAPTAIEDKTPVAIPGDVEARQAKRESIRRQGKRRGRKSTVLTALSDEKLGG